MSFQTATAMSFLAIVDSVNLARRGTIRTSPALMPSWMLIFVDSISTKKITAPALGSIAGGIFELYASSGARIGSATALLV